MPATYYTMYDAIIGTIASIITIYLISYFRSKIDNKKLANVIVIICITLFLLITNFIVKQKIGNNSLFREYLLGNDYFRSTSSAYNYEQDILLMGFDAKIKPGAAPVESGWEQFEFINSTAYHCSFFQTNRQKLNDVKGFRISGDTLKVYNNFADDSDKEKFILYKIKAYDSDTQN